MKSDWNSDVWEGTIRVATDETGASELDLRQLGFHDLCP